MFKEFLDKYGKKGVVALVFVGLVILALAM